MLRLFHADTGRAEPLVPARRGELQIASSGGPAGLAGLCDLLLPDLIRRAAEWHRLRVASAGPPAGQAASALNLRPPDLDELGPAADVHTGAAAGGRWVRSGPVALPAELSGDDPAAALTALASRGLDPLALRLVLLGRRYRDPLTVTWPGLDGAHQELAAWRGLVAGWATQPSRPISAPHRARIAAAFDDDLDTPAALAVLRDLAADPAVPPGARFETFADADRLLGLDLVRDVGRPT